MRILINNTAYNQIYKSKDDRLSRLDPKAIIIEKASIQDINELVKINKEEYWNDYDKIKSAELFELGKWWVIPDLLKWHKNIVNKCGGEILVVKYNDEIIAELDYVISPDHTTYKFERIHIVWLIVKRKYRSMGIAKMLINNLKNQFPKFEIWVEAEDERSLGLYSTLGRKRRHINNWTLQLKKYENKDTITHDVNQLNLINYDNLMDSVKGSKLYPVIGRYYAPIFDLEQLRSSDQVHQYIWGSTEKAKIRPYQYKSLRIIAIQTQFLRIYVDDPNFSRNEFQYILGQIVKDIFEYGFHEIYAQSYSEDNIDISLKATGFTLDDDSDHVYTM